MLSRILDQGISSLGLGRVLLQPVLPELHPPAVPPPDGSHHPAAVLRGRRTR
ncbi:MULTISPECIES: hypothetical protein [Streptomyces]|uniref:hypothetical protein n=1 Tax=Streptomyces TaxID=1883 RepID=UPI00292CEF1C|nr:hypothetical protein [Streptomyces sp. NEAU-HV9]